VSGIGHLFGILRICTNVDCCVIPILCRFHFSAFNLLPVCNILCRGYSLKSKWLCVTLLQLTCAYGFLEIDNFLTFSYQFRKIVEIFVEMVGKAAAHPLGEWFSTNLHSCRMARCRFKSYAVHLLVDNKVCSGNWNIDVQLQNYKCTLI